MKLNIFKKKNLKGLKELKHDMEKDAKDAKADGNPDVTLSKKEKLLLESQKSKISKKLETSSQTREKFKHKFDSDIKHKKEKKTKPKFDKTIKKDAKKFQKLKSKRVLGKKIKKKRKKLSLRRIAKDINLQDFLEKAGVDAKANDVAKKIFRINIIMCFVLTVLIIITAVTFRASFINLLKFLIGFWMAVFFLLLVLIWIIYLFILDMRIFNRTKAVELVFPDFLQLTSANISAGMPIDKALWYAVRPGFGVLAKEIESVAKNTMAGEDLAVALTNFGKKYDSKVIQRSINLLLVGLESGGEMAELLSKIALNIEETRILKQEMGASVTTYVIFITFATILAAPVLFALATQLLFVIKDITATLAPNLMTSGAMFTFSFSSEAIKTSDFRLFSYMMLIISSFSSACIVSVIKKGRLKEGLAQIPIFIIVSVLIYTFASIVIRGMFGAFV